LKRIINKAFPLITIIFVLSGCSDEPLVVNNVSSIELSPIGDTPIDETPVDETPVDETPVDDTPVDDTPECTGFGSPNINVFVYESTNTDFIVQDATVTVTASNESLSESYTASYTEEGNNSDGEIGAYWSLLEFNSSVYDLSLVVSAEGYHSFATKGIPFEVHTSCGADNTLSYDVYLCPIGTGCL
jgi:hypothetical protein